MIILCIDPGTTVSGAVIFCPESMTAGAIYPEIPNEELLAYIEGNWHANGQRSNYHSENFIDLMLIEMVASYGMPVGREVFETVRWIGNFEHAFGRDRTQAVYRRDVKMELCNSASANDANVRRALLDRFPSTGGGATPAIGTKAKPGPLYGLTKHAVSALAVGVAWWATQHKTTWLRGYESNND